MNASFVTVAAVLLSYGSIVLAAPAEVKPERALADFCICQLHYGGYGECVSELWDSQVLAAPEWDISSGPPPLLPAKAEALATRRIAEFVGPYASRPEPLRFIHRKTCLIKRDATRWFYGLTFLQVPAGGATGAWPSIEVFVTFDGKVGSLYLTSPPKAK